VFVIEFTSATEVALNLARSSCSDSPMYRKIEGQPN
jgi:hypothetical protein